ncbi:MAG: DUF4124 domain-containing protein [Pseudomonadota bacterium]
MKLAGWLCWGVLTCLPVSGGSAPVYSWTDADGVTHYSESPPPDAATEHATLELEPAPVLPPPMADDYYSVANQAARMEARRLEQERRRAEIRRLQAEAQRAAAEAAAAAAQPPEAAEARTEVWYPLYPWQRFGYRPYPHAHEYPQRPPQRPPPQRNKKLVIEPERH